MTPSKTPAEILDIGGAEVRISSPDKMVFPGPGVTKLDLVRYYLAVADGALRGAGGRPMVLKRFPKGIDAEPFFQKRVPENRPDFIDTATLHYASGTSAEEAVIRDAAGLAWVVNLGCLDLNPHPVRAEDLEHPDELRVDLDPMPGVDWSQIVDVAYVAREVLDDAGLVGWPKTSGSRGLHILVRIAPQWSYRDVRLAAETLAREVENRAPGLATARWWKEERGESVFVDFNQNAKDRTTAGAYSVRPLPDARVSTPLTWTEVPDCDPAAFTLATVPDRVKAVGDPAAEMDQHPGSLESLLELSARQAAEGQADAPWPPMFAKTADEPTRVAPSRRRGAPGAKRGRQNQALITVAKAQDKADALAGLERWKARHPQVAARLGPTAYLVDVMRGRSSTW